MAVMEVSAPVTSKWPGWRAVSAMNRGATSTTRIPTGTLMNSTQRQDTHSVIQQRHAAEHARLAGTGGRAARRVAAAWRGHRVPEDVHAPPLKLRGRHLSPECAYRSADGS